LLKPRPGELTIQQLCAARGLTLSQVRSGLIEIQQVPLLAVSRIRQESGRRYKGLDAMWEQADDGRSRVCVGSVGPVPVC
jgi:hypothetical protein